MPSVFLPGFWASPGFLDLLEARPGDVMAGASCDYTVHAAPGALPVLVPETGAQVSGIVLALQTPVFERLAALQAIFGAEPGAVTVQSGERMLQVRAFLAPSQPEMVAAETMTTAQATTLCGACSEIMALADAHPIAVLRARWPMALSHAASVLRGQADTARSTLRRDLRRRDVVLERSSQPYAWYFGLREDDLRFRRFDGQMSEQVRRAGFVMSDAVTVLPYDPIRDRVMLVEQFRYGPWLRGVANPWSLEPIAGRIDPFETPEAAALREAQEETGLALSADRLLAVGNVYPSPGAVTEFLYQYVALCDLPDGSDGVSGLETEAEDIRSHVISYARLMDLVNSGEVQNGPLVLTAWWLAAHRDGLRSG